MKKLSDLADVLEKTANMMRGQAAVFIEYGYDDISEGQDKIADQIERTVASIRAGEYTTE